MSKLAKVAKQHEKTWPQLHRRLISIPFDYDCLFPPPVAEFVNKKAALLGSCPGYLVPCLLTSTAYIIAQNFVLRSGLQDMPQNLYMVFVGPPGTGKSQALKEDALQPMHDVRTERDMQNCIIEKCTSSALVKTVAEHNKAFIVSPEVEVLNKLLKLDEENTTGDVQILCQLFSGESSSYRFAMERAREIPAIRSTQVPYAARLLCRMDQGHGLLDRFMFLFPMCLRPTTTETEEAQTWFKSEEVSLKQISDIFLEMHDTRHPDTISLHVLRRCSTTTHRPQG